MSFENPNQSLPEDKGKEQPKTTETPHEYIEKKNPEERKVEIQAGLTELQSRSIKLLDLEYEIAQELGYKNFDSKKHSFETESTFLEMLSRDGHQELAIAIAIKRKAINEDRDRLEGEQKEIKNNEKVEKEKQLLKRVKEI